MDRVSGNFNAGESDPKAANVSGGVATWNLGTLGPKECKTITVNGTSPDEGVVTTCCWATYTPVICQDIHVVKPSLELTKTAPAEVMICDPIPVSIVVKNTGTFPLTGVQVNDTLPSGESADGKTSLMFDAGTLAPGDSKEFKYNAVASTGGKLENTVKATTAEGVTVNASATTTVHQPVLAITCKGTDQQYMGRKFDVSYTVSSTGDSPVPNTVLEVALPANATVVDAGNGQAANGKLTWNLGTVDANAPQTVTATFNSTDGGSFDFAGTAKGTCATAVSTTCTTKVIGIPALLLQKADDPDPVAIGETTTYTVKVTNQGSADAKNVQVVVTVDNQLVPVSTTDGTISGQSVTMPLIPDLLPKQEVTYKVVAKGVTPGDARTKFVLTSDSLSSPVNSEESTHVY
jgi:uncharacterized repeat protein (TIGR01451 family)